MSILTLFLEVQPSVQFELLLISCFYGGLVGLFSILRRPAEYRGYSSVSALLPPFFLILLIVAVNLTALPITLQLIGSSLALVVLSTGAGVPSSVAVELLVAHIAKRISKKRYQIFASGPIGEQQPMLRMNFGIFILLYFGIPILEEILFRGVLISFLLGIYVPPVGAVILSSLAYGINHFFRGPLAVIQKSASGVVFSWIFYLTGSSLLAPILAHVGENLLIKLLGDLRTSPPG